MSLSKFLTGTAAISPVTLPSLMPMGGSTTTDLFGGPAGSQVVREIGPVSGVAGAMTFSALATDPNGVTYGIGRV